MTKLVRFVVEVPLLLVTVNETITEEVEDTNPVATNLADTTVVDTTVPLPLASLVEERATDLSFRT